MQKNTQLNIRVDAQLARQIRAAAALRGERLGDFLERIARSEISRLEKGLSTPAPVTTQEAAR
jgi:uncharacterized protein (DUF1778 family)